MNVVNPESLSGNLHVNPLSARLSRGVATVASMMNKNASPVEWHGRVVVFIAKTAIFAGALAAIPISLIEAVATFMIGSLGIAINKFFFEGRSEFFQKHSLKCLSYSIHSTLITFISFILLWKTPISRFYTATAVASHAIHLGSAAFTQSLIGSRLDADAGRSPRLAITRTFNLLKDSHPDLLNDLLAQVDGEFNLNMRERMGQIPGMEAYLERHPEDREFINTFEFHRLFNDEEYRNRAKETLRRYLADLQLIRAADGANPLHFELNQHTPEVAAYQDYLADNLKIAYVGLYRDPELYHMLDKDGTAGNELLEAFDASIYLPLSGLAQINEIVEEIRCPEAFANNLAPLHPRRAQLLRAKALLEALDERQQERLFEKIIRGADIDVDGPVLELYREVSALAAALYQGPLMKRTAINFAGVAEGNMIEEQNLFQRACQEALAEAQREPVAVAQ